MSKTVSIINGNAQYNVLFHALGYEIVSANKDPDLICFTGGADVSPELYDHPAHHSTFNDRQRDREEGLIFIEALQKGIPMVGICRGAQFLNVMSGGEMYQDVTHHTRSHLIKCAMTGREVLVTSTHHQMMKPSSRAILMASSTLGGNRTYWDGHSFVTEKSEEDIEVVYYPHTKSLCFQPHPEFYHQSYFHMKLYFEKLINETLFYGDGGELS